MAVSEYLNVATLENYDCIRELCPCGFDIFQKRINVLLQYLAVGGKTTGMGWWNLAKSLNELGVFFRANSFKGDTQ